MIKLFGIAVLVFTVLFFLDKRRKSGVRTTPSTTPKWQFWKNWKKTSPSSNPTSPATPSSFSPKKFLFNSLNTGGGTIIWTFVVVVVVAGLVVIGLLTREAIQVFESNPVDKHAPSEKAAVPYLTYGPHTFKQGEENLYNRLGADYFYPAHNGETLVFHFRSVADPSSQWDYKVTRRKDGTIHLEDDCVFNAHDSRLKGDHMVTLTSGDADIMYDNKPLPQ